jgi:hypothetical protein
MRSGRRFHVRAAGWKAEETGSFIIEAALVFPAVLLATVAVIFFSIYVYQKGALLHTASVAAERMAFSWNNSHKDPVTGAYSVLEHDGLYWHLFQDQATGIFGLGGEKDDSIALPDDAGRTDLNLTRQKLLRAAPMLAGAKESRLMYTNRLLDRSVSVQLLNPFSPPATVKPLLPVNLVQAVARSRIVDPVEYIRLIDFSKDTAEQLKGRISPENAERLFREPDRLSSPSQFQGHDIDAAPYLRKLVNGREAEMELAQGTRRVDALDKSGVAHQAYCTYTKSNLLKEQMPRDVWLLQQGKVKGVVWHFFANCRGKQPKPSETLQRQLQKQGIVIVIHD